MAAIVTIDKAGRIVIPKETRTAQRIRSGTKFLLVEGPGGRLWLQRLDPREIAEQIEKELRGVDIEPVLRKVRAEIQRLALERYPALARK